MKIPATLLLVCFLAGCQVWPPVPELAQDGALRVAVLTSNPLIGSKDATTGALKGTTVDLGHALAKKAGIPVRFIEYQTIGKLMEDTGERVWDVAVIAVDPARRKVLNFAPAHFLSDFTALVPPGSVAKTVA